MDDARGVTSIKQLKQGKRYEIREEPLPPEFLVSGSCAATEGRLPEHAQKFINILLQRGLQLDDVCSCLSDMSPSELSELTLDLLQSLVQSRQPETVSTSAAVSIITAASPVTYILVEKLLISAIFPESNLKKGIELQRGDRFADIVRKIQDSVGFRLDLAEVVLTRVDWQGWSTEISHNEPISSDAAVALSDLRDRDCVEIRRLVGWVGGRFRLSSIAASERFNQSLQLKVVEMSSSLGYTGYRKIRGDGNCYYRAIIVGLFEQIINSNSRHSFLQLWCTFEENVRFPGGSHDHIMHLNLLRKLNDAAISDSMWKTFAEFEKDLLSEESNLDVSLVRACKQMVAYLLIRDQDTMHNGLSLSDAILPSHDDVSDIRAFCDEYVMKMGVCAEGAHIDLGLLPQALGCESHIVILSRDATAPLTRLDTALGSGVAKIGDVHLLFRPGHYDLLYPAATQFPAPALSISSYNSQGSSPQPPIQDSISPAAPVQPLADASISRFDLVPRHMSKYLADRFSSVEAVTQHYLPNTDDVVRASSAAQAMMSQSVDDERIAREMGSRDVATASQDRKRKWAENERVARELAVREEVQRREQQEWNRHEDERAARLLHEKEHAIQQLQNLTELEGKWHQGLTNLGCEVSKATLKKLSARCSSEEAGLDYYLKNIHLFSDAPTSVLAGAEADAVGGGGGGGSFTAARNPTKLEQFLDAPLLRESQSHYPMLLDPARIATLNLCVGLGLNQSMATSIMASGCYSLYSVVKVHLGSQTGRGKYLDHVGFCEAFEKEANPVMDEVIFETVRRCVSTLPYDIANVLEAVVIDYCVTPEEVIDAINALQITGAVVDGTGSMELRMRSTRSPSSISIDEVCRLVSNRVRLSALPPAKVAALDDYTQHANRRDLVDIHHSSAIAMPSNGLNLRPSPLTLRQSLRSRLNYV